VDSVGRVRRGLCKLGKIGYFVSWYWLISFIKIIACVIVSRRNCVPLSLQAGLGDARGALGFNPVETRYIRESYNIPPARVVYGFDLV